MTTDFVLEWEKALGYKSDPFVDKILEPRKIQDILKLLKEIQVDYAQGFGIHVPEALEPLNIKVHYLSEDKFKIN